MEAITQNKNQTLVKPIMSTIHRIREELKEMEEELNLLSDKELLESIEKGEKDIEAGNCTVCKKDEEIEDFFKSV